MGHDHSHPSFERVGRLDHVLYEGIIALAFWWNATVEAAEAILLRDISAPFIEGERRIGYHYLEVHQVVTLNQERVAQCVAPLNARVVDAVEEHIHLRQRPGASVALLAVQGEVVATDVAGALDQQ